MKKILYVATVASHICQFHLPYLKMFQEKGYEVHVAARNNLAEKNGLQLKNVDRFFETPFQRAPFNLKNIKAYGQLKKIINNNQYDLIVCNTPVGGILTRMAAKKARKNGAKVLYIAHGFHFYKGASKKNWLIYYPIEKYFAKQCDMLITINEEDYLLAKEKFAVQTARIHGVGVDPNRYTLISLEERQKRRLNLGYTEEQFLVLVVGELLPNKNQLQAIKAIEEVVKKSKQIKLLIAGNGKERDVLEKYVQEHELSNYVEFLGYCTRLEDYQCCIDLGVSCSIREGLGLNVIESMMSGNTFIATRNRGHNELIEDGQNGFLVDIGDVSSLAERILFLMENQSIREQMQKNAIGFVERYSLKETKKEMLDIVEQVIGQ